MYSSFQLAVKYLRYYVTAYNSKGHGMHSPFVYDFIKNVLNDTTEYEAYRQVEALREKMLQDHRLLAIEDMGAGSTGSNKTERSIASIAKRAAKPPKLGKLLYRIAAYYQPTTILELGTSLGITTAYLAMANKKATVLSIEGAPAIAQQAIENMAAIPVNNVTIITGNFDGTLVVQSSKLAPLKMVFIDGNHRKEPTIAYFEQLLSFMEDDTILVFDDIHWSREMEEAWKIIKAYPAVQCSIDLFFLGIIFFRKSFREKQHFIIRF